MEVADASVLLALFAAFFLTSQTSAASKDKKTNYGVLLDAGSTGTKLKIYSWRTSTSEDVPPQVALSSDKKFKPGLSSFFDDPTNLEIYLRTILTWAKTKIPENHHSKTPIYLMATAGLRYLKLRNTNHLLTTAHRLLKKINPFAPIELEDVDVLSGEEEAIYAWIAVNYLLEFFSPNPSMEKSVGLLEMGGGSTQIAFIPNGPIYSEEFQVRLSGKVYSVYVQSYLQFGSNGIAIKVADALRRRQANNSHVNDPCALQGDSSAVAFEDGTSIRLHGTGDPTECQKVLKEILKPATGVACQPKPCSMGAVHQPSVEGITFYATQAYEYAPQNLGALGPDGMFNMSIVLEKVTAYCKKPLEEVLKIPNVRAKYASADCLMGLYVPSLLQTFGFPRETDQIKMTSKVNSLKIDWSLGAMLVKLSDWYSLHSGNYSVECLKRSKTNSGFSLNLKKSYIFSKQYLTLFYVFVMLRSLMTQEWFYI